MPSEIGLRSEQKTRLYQLLAIKATQTEYNDTLEGFISITKTAMDEEDVAYVEKQIAQRYKN